MVFSLQSLVFSLIPMVFSLQSLVFSLIQKVFSLQSLVFSLIQKVYSLQSNSDGLRPAEFWALRDISFDLKRGECLGLLGKAENRKQKLEKVVGILTHFCFLLSNFCFTPMSVV